MKFGAAKEGRSIKTDSTTNQIKSGACVAHDWAQRVLMFVVVNDVAFWDTETLT